MKPTILMAALLVSAPLSLMAQAAPAPAAPAAPAAPVVPPGYEVPKDMTTYYLALYVRGPNFIANDSPEQQALTKRHLSYIRQMIEQRKYMLAGPLLDGGPQLGMAIISAPNAEEAKRIAGGDPAIAAGHMAAEVRPAMLPSLASLVVKY